jgi:hypothetical protein
MLFAPVLLALALQTPAQGAPAVSLADLVPANTVAFVQSPSLERAAQFVGRMMQAFGPPGGPEIDAAKLLSLVEVPGDASAVDSTRPVGLCLLLDEGAGAEPLPAFLIPALDADKYLKSIAASGSGMQGVAKGGYVCVGLGGAPELPSSPAAIAKGLPEGELSARIDVGRLIEQFREPIDQGLNRIEEEAGAVSGATAGGIDPKPMLGAYVDGIRDIVDSAETLDLALHLEGDELELGFALTNAEGSALASFGSKEKTGVRALTGLLDEEACFSMLMGMDLAAMTKRFQPFLDTLPNVYPEALRPAMKQLLDHVADFYGFMGTAQAASMDFTGSGMRYRIYSQGGDSQKLLDVYRKLDEVLPGLGLTPIPEREVAGVKVNGLRLKLDIAALIKQFYGKDFPHKEDPQLDTMMEKMFGKDGLAIQVASKSGVSMLVLGGDDEYLGASIAKLSSKSAPPAYLARALAQVGDLNPCLIVRYDLGRMIDGMKDLMSSIAPDAAVGLSLFPIALSPMLWGGVDGRVWRGGLSTNLSEIAALVHKGEAKPR